MIEFRNVRKRLVSQRNSLALIVEDFRSRTAAYVVGENGTGKTTTAYDFRFSQADFGEIIVSSPTIAFTNIESSFTIGSLLLKI